MSRAASASRGGVVAAVDLGATSGRVMLGYVQEGMLRLEPVSRFPNGPVSRPDGLRWDFSQLYRHVVEGLRAALAREPDIASVGVDSWAVDYGLIGGGDLLGEPFHYRDDRTARGVDAVHACVPPRDLYRRNGLQFLPFNTLYQYASEPGFDHVDAALLIPDLIAYLLSGARIAERTNASTTGLLDVRTGQWDVDLAADVGIPASVLPRLVDPGESLGAVRGGARELIGSPLELITVGSHDTASAVVAVPMTSPNAVYISCGTWGLVGVELDEPVLTDAARDANFTNERGVDGRVRFLHNVTGLWLLSETVRAWEAQDGAPIDLPALLDAAATAEHGALFDANDPRLSAPGDMPGRIGAVLEESGQPRPRSRPAFARTIVESIAHAFVVAAATAGRLTGRDIDVIHVVGGGALNRLLCQATADRSGLPVLAGPVEATAIGNVLVQARAHGWFGPDASLETLREAVAVSFPAMRYEPRPRTGA